RGPARRAGRLPADRQRHRRRGGVQADLRRRAARCGRPDDEGRARDGHGRREALTRTLFLVNPASANGETGKRWPELERRARELGLDGETRLSTGPGDLAELARTADADLLPVVGGRGAPNEVVHRPRAPRSSVMPRAPGVDFAR